MHGDQREHLLEEGSMNLRILRPDGAIIQPARQRAPGRAVLAGARIGVLDNLKPNAGLLMTTVADRLAARAGTGAPVILTKVAAVPASEEQFAQLAKEVDLVITGSAD
jgi:hypothetical protein